MAGRADRPYGTFRVRHEQPVPPETPAPARPGGAAGLRDGFRRIERRRLVRAGALVALALWLLSIALTPAAPRPLSQRQVEEVVLRAIASASPRPNPAVALFEKLAPSVVSIRVRVGSLDGPEAGGAGTIIDEQGDILTSLHVVDGAVRITVQFSNGAESPAGIVAQVPENDVAVIRATNPPQPLVPAVLGDPSALRIGEDVYAIGDPFGLQRSLSAGIVSQLGRTVTVAGHPKPFVNLIQFDAAVNPGSSGGPLLNRDGDVVGVVTGIPSTGPASREAFAGIGLAVRIDTAASAAGSPPY